MKNYLNSVWVGLLICFITGNVVAQTVETDRSKPAVPVKNTSIALVNHVSEPDRSKEPFSGKPATQSSGVINNPSAIDLSKLTPQSVAKKVELKSE